MKKRLLSVFLALVMVMSLAPLALAADEEPVESEHYCVENVDTGEKFITLDDAIASGGAECNLRLLKGLQEGTVPKTSTVHLDTNGYILRNAHIYGSLSCVTNYRYNFYNCKFYEGSHAVIDGSGAYTYYQSNKHYGEITLIGMQMGYANNFFGTGTTTLIDCSASADGETEAWRSASGSVYGHGNNLDGYRFSGILVQRDSTFGMYCIINGSFTLTNCTIKGTITGTPSRAAQSFTMTDADARAAFLEANPDFHVNEETGLVWREADESVCQIGKIKYMDLQTAIDAAKAGDTITLTANVTGPFIIRGNASDAKLKNATHLNAVKGDGKADDVTIDLNGYNVAAGEGDTSAYSSDTFTSGFNVYGKLTLTNSAGTQAKFGQPTFVYPTGTFIANGTAYDDRLLPAESYSLGTGANSTDKSGRIYNWGTTTLSGVGMGWGCVIKDTAVGVPADYVVSKLTMTDSRPEETHANTVVATNCLISTLDCTTFELMDSTVNGAISGTPTSKAGMQFVMGNATYRNNFLSANPDFYFNTPNQVGRFVATDGTNSGDLAKLINAAAAGKTVTVKQNTTIASGERVLLMGTLDLAGKTVTVDANASFLAWGNVIDSSNGAGRLKFNGTNYYLSNNMTTINDANNPGNKSGVLPVKTSTGYAFFFYDLKSGKSVVKNSADMATVQTMLYFKSSASATAADASRNKTAYGLLKSTGWENAGIKYYLKLESAGLLGEQTYVRFSNSTLNSLSDAVTGANGANKMISLKLSGLSRFVGKEIKVTPVLIIGNAAPIEFATRSYTPAA